MYLIIAISYQSWNINQELMVPITSANMAPNTLDFTPSKSPITGWNPLWRVKNQAWAGQLKQFDENTKILLGPTITRPSYKTIELNLPLCFQEGHWAPWRFQTLKWRLRREKLRWGLGWCSGLNRPSLHSKTYFPWHLQLFCCGSTVLLINSSWTHFFQWELIGRTK